MGEVIGYLTLLTFQGPEREHNTYSPIVNLLVSVIYLLFCVSTCNLFSFMLMYSALDLYKAGAFSTEVIPLGLISYPHTPSEHVNIMEETKEKVT